jgi:hypothetical protein
VTPSGPRVQLPFGFSKRLLVAEILLAALAGGLFALLHNPGSHHRAAAPAAGSRYSTATGATGGARGAVGVRDQSLLDALAPLLASRSGASLRSASAGSGAPAPP